MSDSALYQLPLTIELKAPVLFRDSVGDENMVNSVDYIPGSAILGAFAGFYIKKYGAVDHRNSEQFTSFAELFLKEIVRFLNGYIQIERELIQDNVDKGNKKKEAVFARSLPVPLSIQYSKNQEALAEEKFFQRKIGESGHDGAWELVTFESLLNQPSDIAASVDTVVQNGVEATKYRGGYCLLDVKDLNCTFVKTNVSKQYQVHHQRTDQRVGRSAGSEIYNYESILPRQIFMAAILGPKDKLDELKTLLHENDSNIRLGRSRHTQYGNAKMIAGDIRLYQDEADSLRSSNILSDRQFILTCASDIVFDAMVKKIDIDEITNMVQSALNYKDLKLTYKNAFFKVDVVERYNAAWKARTPSQLCLVKGSCIVFEIVSHTLKDLQSRLNELQQDGLGVRRNEGFGRVLINWQGLPLNAYESRIASDRCEAPNDSVAPDAVLPLLQGLLKQWLIEQTQVYASQIVRKEAGDQGFKKLTSTQLNKLKRIALNAKDFKYFNESISELTHKDDLDKIYFQDMSLYHFLCFDHFAGLRKDGWLDDEKPAPFIAMIQKYGKGNPQFRDFLAYSNSVEYLRNPDLSSNLFVTFYDTLFTLLDKFSRKNGARRSNGENIKRGEQS